MRCNCGDGYKGQGDDVAMCLNCMGTGEVEELKVEPEELEPFIKLTEEEADELKFGWNAENYDVVEESELTDQGKYQSGYVIFCGKEQTETGPYFRLEISRSGNYWSGYEYEYDDLKCHRVVKKEKVITTWVDVPQPKKKSAQPKAAPKLKKALEAVNERHGGALKKLGQ